MVLYFKRTVPLCHFIPTDCVANGIISIDFMVKHSTVLYFWLRNTPCQYTITNEWLFPYSFQLVHESHYSVWYKGEYTTKCIQ